MHRGLVYFLPPFSTQLDDPERHPHVLMTGERTSVATLVYGSSSQGAVGHGAACYMVAVGQGQLADKPRLRRDTYFYGGILARAKRALLSRPIADVRPCLGDIDNAVRKAIGYGSGAAYDQPRGVASLRGQIVEFQQRHADTFQTRFGVILTEHRYSQRRHYQVLVPLIDATDRESPPSAIVFSERGWIRPLFGAVCERVVAAGRLVHSVWHEKRISGETRYAMAPADLVQIERDVCDWLQLQ